MVTNDGEVPITNVSVNDSPQGAVANIVSQGNGDSTLDIGRVVDVLADRVGS